MLSHMQNSYFIKGARLVDPARGLDAPGDILIRDGLIADPKQPHSDVPVIEAKGLVIAPAFVDLHVHFREPGFEAAETVASGAQAAARGGFSTVLMMPNTAPPVDSPERVAQQIRLGQAIRSVRILTTGCLTHERAGDAVADLVGMRKAGAAAFTDDGSTVRDRSVMEAAMRAAAALGCPVMDHALDTTLSGSDIVRAGPAATQLGVDGLPAEAESSIVARDIDLCRSTGCPVHIQHVSTRESVALITAAREEGLPVSGEATPHHLALVDTDIPPTDTHYKMAPPLGHAEDRDALIHAVCQGILQAFATDHAPHPAVDKARDFHHAPFGVVGLETAAAATYTTLVQSGRLSLAQWVTRWTVGPATVLGWAPPTLAVGQPAHVVLFDPAAQWTVDPNQFASRSHNTPFAGRTLTGQVVGTWHHGRRVAE